jgi:hypothetical protein
MLELSLRRSLKVQDGNEAIVTHPAAELTLNPEPVKMTG